MQKFALFLFLLSLLVIACQDTANNSTETEEPEPSTETISLEEVWATDTLLTTPESVLYDESRGVYYVSCIGGVPPFDNDGDGFIAKVDTAGNIIEQKWVTGLNGPKGLGLVDNTLYVADNDRLVSIDVTTGKILNKLPIAEAKNLNDVAIGKMGEVYVSDSQTSTAYKVTGQEVATVVNDTAIGGLNGVFVDGNSLLFAGFGSGKLFTFDPNTKQLTQVSDSMVGGDGIEKYGTGFFVSSWNGEIYHLDSDWNRTKVLDTKAQEINAADIEIVESKQLLLVPTFFDNRVVAYRIHGK